MIDGKSNYELGLKLYNAGKYEKAIEKLEKSVYLEELDNNEFYSAYVTLGACCNNAEFTSDAIENLEYALKYISDDYRAYDEFANAYFTYSLPLAELFFNKALELHPNKAELCFEKVKNFFNAGMYEEAEKVLDIGLKYLSDSDCEVTDAINQYRFLINLGEKYSLASDLQSKCKHDEALKICDYVLESLDSDSVPKFTDEIYRENVKPFHDKLLASKAECLHVLGIFYTEAEIYKELIATSHEDANLYGKIAYCYVELNMLDKALEYYAKAEDLTEKKEKHKFIAGKHRTICDIFIKNKNYQAALDYAKSLPEDNYSSVCLKKILLGRAYFYLEKYDDVLNCLLPYTEDKWKDKTGSNFVRGMAYTYVGGAYYKRKDYKTALKYLRNTTKIKFKSFADTWLFMAECYIALKKYDKALSALDRAAETVDELTTYNIPYVNSRHEFAYEKFMDRDVKRKIECVCPECEAKVGSNDSVCRSCGNRLKWTIKEEVEIDEDLLLD